MPPLPVLADTRDPSTIDPRRFSSPSIRLTESQRAAIARDLANHIEGEVRFDVHNRMLYATDASLYQVEPLGVVIPASVDDAARIVRFCAQRGLPILPRGGGTSLAGQCTNRAVVIDFSNRCNRHEAVDIAQRRVRVEPGITVDDLNDSIASTGLFFAADPATSRHANIGGCIGNNAAGARSIRYGRTSENLLAVDVALADGRRVRLDEGAWSRDPVARELTEKVVDVVRRYEPLIRERFPKTLRRNAGYGLDMILQQLDAAAAAGRDPSDLSTINLAKLIAGSEGTLAVTLGAELKLEPKPRVKGLAVLGFSDLDESIAAVLPILTTNPTAVELLDDTVIDLARANNEYKQYVELMPQPNQGTLKAVLYVEYFGAAPAEIEAGFAKLRAVTPDIAALYLTDTGEMLNAWKLRKAGEPLLHGVPGNRKPITFIEDNAIPVERLSEFVKRLRQIVADHGTIAAFYAHASVGVLHVRPLVDIHDPEDRAIMRSISTKTADLAKELGGVMSGEHGDGRVRSPFLERYFGPELMTAFREIKAIFDPHNLLNPGNIVEPRPIETMTQLLRVMPASPPSPPTHDRLATVPDSIDTYFDYTDQHGFDSAVEMCNGAGVCRKKQGGTMCPSYMATLDERHATRGRGNALRLAITGQLGALRSDGSRETGPNFDDPGTIETLNLCLSCKACKTECPSNVDIARLKAEYTAQRYAAKGTPLQARIFGAVRLLNRLGSITPALANWINRTPPARAFVERILGLDPRRSLPPFARSLASQWKREPERGGPRVVLFGDCFTMFNEPGIGLATRRVYEAFGYTVDLADAGCCGRAKISTGLLPQAIEEVDSTLTRLSAIIDDPTVEAILVAEPSCLSAMKDDWLTLKLKTPMELRRRLAAKAFLPEQFLDLRWDQHPRRPRFQTPPAAPSPVMLHGHCHQKALWGAASSAAVLHRIFGKDAIKVLDTGCCGMAGSFGYTADRYNLSMQIGELTLFPAVRAAATGTPVLAPGTSCRHQIHDGTGRRAEHPVELLARMLEG